MTEYVVMPKADWLEILAAARSKTGTTGGILSGELAAKILAISTGITPSGTRTITANGTYDVTNYAKAAVNVPETVPDGYLKPSGALDITANGTGIDVAAYAAVNVAVPVPSGSSPFDVTVGSSDTGDMISGDGFQHLEVGWDTDPHTANVPALLMITAEDPSDYGEYGSKILYVLAMSLNLSSFSTVTVCTAMQDGEIVTSDSPTWFNYDSDEYTINIFSSHSERQFNGRYRIAALYYNA